MTDRAEYKRQWRAANPELPIERELYRQRRKELNRSYWEKMRDGHLADTKPKKGSGQEKVLAIIRRAAKKQLTCPSNDDIAKQLGMTRMQVANAVLKLVVSGRIMRETDGHLRRKFALPDGDATSWGKQPDRSAQAKNVYAAAVARREEARPSIKLRKCLSCGGSFKPEHQWFFRCTPCKQSQAAAGDNGFHDTMAAW